MYEIVSKYVKGCVLCATNKPSNKKLGLYTLRLVPSQPWQSVSMNFVGCLSMSIIGHNCLYFIVDRFSKIHILIPCKNKVTNEQKTQLFFNNVWVHFGLPTSILSNLDSRFLGKLWSSLWRFMESKLKKNIVFHP